MTALTLSGGHHLECLLVIWYHSSVPTQVCVSDLDTRQENTPQIWTHCLGPEVEAASMLSSDSVVTEAVGGGFLWSGISAERSFARYGLHRDVATDYLRG